MGMMIHRAKMRQVRQAMYEPQKVEQPKVEQPKEVVKENEGVKYTKEEINSLPFFSLKSIANKYGIDVKGKKTADLRAAIIEKLGL